MAAGIILPSSCSAGTGFFFVAKKDKTLRPCINYWGLNNITIKNRYPIPLISSAFELLQGATIFTKRCLPPCPHQEERQVEDFNTLAGHYEYLVMPFGLISAPAVFQALINDVLQDMTNKHKYSD